MEDISILLVDDHKLVREGIKQMLKYQQKYMLSIDEAEDGKQAIEKAAINVYDIIIMDIHMPNKDGVEATKTIMRDDSKNKILGLSMYNENYQIVRMMNAGAKGYILKDVGPEELTKAITVILNNGTYYSNEVANTLLDSKPIEPKQQSSGRKKKPKINLTPRENDILKLIIKGKSSDAIALQLSISKRTVDWHRKNMIDKFDVINTTGLIKYAADNNLIRL